MSLAGNPPITLSLLFLLLTACMASGGKEKPGQAKTQAPAAKSATTTSAAKASIAAPWACPDTGWLLTSTKPPGKRGDAWGIQPGRAGSSEEDRKGYETVYWTGDLSGDGIEDLITGENPQAFSHTAVLVGCGGGRYYEALHEMTESIAVTDPQGKAGGWKRLRVEFWPHGLDEGQRVLYGWQGGQYAKCCQYPVHIDSAAAPDRPCCP